MSSTFGSNIRLTIFGQSHGEAVGMVLDGFPAGLDLDMERIAREMERRRPGRSPMATARREDDLPHFVSGVFRGKTSGQPICALIPSRDQHSQDYGEQVDRLRPSHADYTGHVRYYGYEDFRGGGSFSGRLTAPVVLAGTLCAMFLEKEGIQVQTHIRRIGGEEDISLADVPEDDNLDMLRQMTLPVLKPEAGEAFRRIIEEASADRDSVGGEVEGRILGVPAGLGSPFFDSMESVLAHLFFSVPGVKGVSFGDGFALACMRGSRANDSFCLDGKNIRTRTNHAGGINGGISNGMPILFTCAMRPTPSIARKQETVSLKEGRECELEIHGRHDPCIVVRAVPVMEAMAWFGLMDLWKERKACLGS